LPTRRALLAGIALMPGLARGSGIRPTLGRRCVSAIATSLDALGHGPALLASYPDVTGGAKSFATANEATAYVYDNTLAGLALLASGDPARASRIGDALVLAQAHDPDFSDGRLRNAYRAGAMQVPIALPGWWDAAEKKWAEDPYQIGSEAGPIAWAILLWTWLAKHGVNSESYLSAARRAARWIAKDLRAPAGFYGGYFGFPPKPQKLLWISTEQNTDLATAFRRLGMTAEADHASGFVQRMRDPKSGLFVAGLAPNGERNPMIAADANLWPYLSGIADASVIEALIGKLGWPRANAVGIGFSEASQGIWMEGTCFAALALTRAGKAEGAQAFLATVAAATAPSSYVFATSTQTLATGLTIGLGADSPKFEYYRVPALAPTAWAVLAAQAFDPLTIS